jgi:tetrahydromethanopterin S-methyltransferase subunit B
MKSLAAIAVIFLISFSASAQTDSDEKKLSLNSGSIDDQFEYVIKKSSGWRDERGQQYKVIKINWLYELRTHTIDSLKAVHKNLLDTKAIVSSQDNEIADLKSSLLNTQTNLDKTNNEKNNMSLFGLQMSKVSYNMLMWSIIGALLALLIFFVYKFNNSNVVTKEAKLALAEMEEEFEEHRKVALEREQKVRRQLQDEINKQKDSKKTKP